MQSLIDFSCYKKIAKISPRILPRINHLKCPCLDNNQKIHSNLSFRSLSLEDIFVPTSSSPWLLSAVRTAECRLSRFTMLRWLHQKCMKIVLFKKGKNDHPLDLPVHVAERERDRERCGRKIESVETMVEQACDVISLSSYSSETFHLQSHAFSHFSTTKHLKIKLWI